MVVFCGQNVSKREGKSQNGRKGVVFGKKAKKGEALEGIWNKGFVKKGIAFS